MGTKQLTKQLMVQLVEKCRRRKPDMEYFYIPTQGWFTKNEESIPCPPVFSVEPNPYAEYHVFMYEAIWRLHKETASGQYLVSKMEAYPSINNIVYLLWVLSTDELCELMLDFVRQQDSRTQSSW
jgi:hypothetical protein